MNPLRTNPRPEEFESEMKTTHITKRNTPQVFFCFKPSIGGEMLRNDTLLHLHVYITYEITGVHPYYKTFHGPTDWGVGP